VNDAQVWTVIAGMFGVLGFVVAMTLRTVRAEIRVVDTRTGGLGDRLGSRIDAVEVQLGSRIDAVEVQLGSRIDAVEVRIDTVEGKIDALDVRLSEKIDRLDRDIQVVINHLMRGL
jgi:hypothetical protein